MSAPRGLRNILSLEDFERHAVSLLRDEIDRDMAMLGISTLGQIKREMPVPGTGPLPVEPFAGAKYGEFRRSQPFVAGRRPTT